MHRWTQAAGIVAWAALASNAHPADATAVATGHAGVTHAPHGRMPDGAPVDALHPHERERHVEVRAITYGSLRWSRCGRPTARAGWTTWCWGSTRSRATRKSGSHMGSVIRRYGNRIANATVHARREDVRAGGPPTAPTTSTAA